MKDEAAVRNRIAKLMVLREGMHSDQEIRELTYQINENRWLLDEMEEAGAGALLPAQPDDERAIDVLITEQRVEDEIRQILQYVHHRVSRMGSHETESFMLQRLAYDLQHSGVIERQTEFLKFVLFDQRERATRQQEKPRET